MTYRLLAMPIPVLLLQLTMGCSHAAGGGAPAPVPAPLPVPVPNGLKGCAPGGPAAADMEHTVSALRGRSLGCFQSSDTTALHGSKKTHALPLETAFAVEMTGGPYAAQDLDKLKSDVAQTWKNFEPLSQDTRADYDRRINGLIEAGAQRETTKPAGSDKPPVLVSIEQLGPKSFAVVTIRRHQISLDGELFSVARADAAAVVLAHAKLIRLSIARDLRSTSDVAAIREEIADWAYTTLAGAP